MSGHARALGAHCRAGQGVRARSGAPRPATCSKCCFVTSHLVSLHRGKARSEAILASAAPAALDTAPEVSSTGIEYGLACAQGPRETMEDQLCVVPDIGSDQLLAAVFDGHGGDAAAEWLHENLPDFVEAAIAQSQNFSAGLRAAFQVADSELLSYLESASSDGKLLTGAGATASVLLVDLKHVVAANVGDSTAILMRYGEQITLTSAHRLYGQTQTAKDEIKRVNDAGGWIGDGRVCDVLAVSRAFGDWEFKGGNTDTLLKEGVTYEWWDQAFADKQNITGDLVIVTPDVTKTEVSEAAGDEFIIVASDGLWDFYKPSDAMNFARNALKSGQSAQAVADALVERALKRYTADNVSVCLLKFPWAFKGGQGKSAGSKP